MCRRLTAIPAHCWGESLLATVEVNKENGFVQTLSPRVQATRSASLIPGQWSRSRVLVTFHMKQNCVTISGRSIISKRSRSVYNKMRFSSVMVEVQSARWTRPHTRAAQATKTQSSPYPVLIKIPDTLYNSELLS